MVSGLVMVLAVVALFFWKVEKSENPMVGTWVMISGVYMGPDGQAGDLSPGSSRQMKVINGSHFTTLWQDTLTRENMGFNGGSYTFENNIYTEYLDFFSITGRIGDTAHYLVELRGNRLSISACNERGEISATGYFQEWERID